MSQRHLLIFNQAANYLTVGLANAFAQKFDSVTLLVGTLHEQGEHLSSKVSVSYINRWKKQPGWKKAASYLFALGWIWWLLMTRYRKHEVLFVSVPPMGYLLNLFVFNRFSMIIWDLYPDALKVTGMVESHPIYRIWSWLNCRAFRKAYRLFTIGKVIAEAMTRYADREKIIVHPIWAAFDSQTKRIPSEENLFLKQHQLHGKFIVQYSGNIGLTHNVEILIDLAERLQEDARVLVQIIGGGPRWSHLGKLVAQRELTNVQLLPFQCDEMFPHSLSAASLGVVVLDEKVSRGSVPSKAYNLMSLGIPSLYIAAADSELAAYAKNFGHGRCFNVGQVDEMVSFIRNLVLDSEMNHQLSCNAQKAAMNFQPGNAKLFVTSYLNS